MPDCLEVSGRVGVGEDRVRRVGFVRPVDGARPRDVFFVVEIGAAFGDQEVVPPVLEEDFGAFGGEAAGAVPDVDYGADFACELLAGKWEMGAVCVPVSKLIIAWLMPGWISQGWLPVT